MPLLKTRSIWLPVDIGYPDHITIIKKKTNELKLIDTNNSVVVIRGRGLGQHRKR